MGEDNITRKLAAIFYADVAGYSRLTGADEEATHRALSASLDAITATIEGHGGRVLHYAGDAILAEFASVVVAVTCAIDIQRDLAARNHGLSEDRKLQFRIGVNLGDVIVDRGELYGDGVNVAARLEGLAEPGGICIPRKVLEEVRDKLKVGFEFLGDQSVKNIDRPIPVYRVLLEPDAAGKVIGERRLSPRQWQLGAAAAAVVAVAAIAAVWWQPWVRTVEPASVERMAFPLPDKPSIAVLPFINMSGDPEQEYFADGMTEDLITDLSQISSLFVIARNTVFTYKGGAVNVTKVAEELGVRYVLEGSVRRVGDQVRINAQLIDATSGGHVWAGRYDGTLNDVFALQDKITQKIVTALAVNLTSQENTRRAQKETENPRAYEMFLQGWALYRRYAPTDFAAAVPYFEKAVALDPSYGRAYAALASIYWEGWRHSFNYELGLSGWFEPWDRAEEWLAKALRYPTPLAHMVASAVLIAKREHDAAIAEAQRAIALDANDPFGHRALAEALIWAGRPAEAVDSIETAMRLDPQDRGIYLNALGFAQLQMGQYKAAAASLEKGTKRSPAISWNWVRLAAAYGELGRETDAKFALEKANVLRLDAGRPPWRLDLQNSWPYKEQADRDRLREALRKAGITH